jgi:hypothetical protein
LDTLKTSTCWTPAATVCFSPFTPGASVSRFEPSQITVYVLLDVDLFSNATDAVLFCSQSELRDVGESALQPSSALSAARTATTDRTVRGILNIGITPGPPGFARAVPHDCDGEHGTCQVDGGSEAGERLESSGSPDTGRVE